MSIPRVNRGEGVGKYLTAETWNSFVDAANYHKIRGEKNTNMVFSEAEVPAHTVMVKNNTGAARERGEILGLNGPIITSAQNLDVFKTRIGFNGITPTASHHGQFCVLQESIPAGEIGLASLTGTVVCQVQINYTFLTRCDVEATYVQRLYAKPNGSAQILWAESGTGNKWAIVRLGANRDAVVLGKTTAPVTVGSTSNLITVWHGGAATGLSLSGVRFDWMTGDQQISNGKQVMCTWFADEQVWRITGAECE